MNYQIYKLIILFGFVSFLFPKINMGLAEKNQSSNPPAKSEILISLLNSQVLGNEELGSRQSPSDLLLAGDTDVAGQCQSAEDLAHDLLMAMSEGEYLKTGSTFISELPKTTHGAIGSEVSYEPLSLGLATSSVDVRPDRSTLDLTGQFSRSHLSLSHPF